MTTQQSILTFAIATRYCLGLAETLFKLHSDSLDGPLEALASFLIDCNAQVMWDYQVGSWRPKFWLKLTSVSFATTEKPTLEIKLPLLEILHALLEASVQTFEYLICEFRYPFESSAIVSGDRFSPSYWYVLVCSSSMALHPTNQRDSMPVFFPEFLPVSATLHSFTQQITMVLEKVMSGPDLEAFLKRMSLLRFYVAAYKQYLAHKGELSKRIDAYTMHSYEHPFDHTWTTNIQVLCREKIELTQRFPQDFMQAIAKAAIEFTRVQ